MRFSVLGRPELSQIRTLLDRAHPLIDEFLKALSFPGLGGVDVALGLSLDAVNPIELPWLASTVPERVEHFEGLSVQHVDLPVLAIGHIHEALRRVA